MGSAYTPPQQGEQERVIPPTYGEREEALCDRCCYPMFRMRAVYWCERCGYKTDCCGS